MASRFSVSRLALFLVDGDSVGLNRCHGIIVGGNEVVAGTGWEEMGNFPWRYNYMRAGHHVYSSLYIPVAPHLFSRGDVLFGGASLLGKFIPPTPQAKKKYPTTQTFTHLGHTGNLSM